MDFNYDFQGAIMKKIAIYFTFIGGLFSMDSRQLSQVSLSFDGKDDYVSFENPINWSEKDKISFSVWIKLNNDMPTSHQDILRQDKNGNPDFYIGFDGKGIFEFALRAGGYNELELQAGEFSEWSNWVHIVGTYDGTSQKLYKNGIEIGSATKISGNLNFSSDNPFTLGCSPHGGAPNSFFDGSIDDFAIWDAALTSSEIEALYNSGMGLSASKSSANYKSAGNLKAYWHIYEGSGNTISDNVDNNNGTIIGASWQNTGMNIQKNKPPSSFKWVDSKKDTINITKENLATQYKFEWTASTDSDGDKLSYILHAKIGSTPWQEINEDIEGTSFESNYGEFLEAAFEAFPIVNAVTAAFKMEVTDGIDTVKMDDIPKVIYIRRYDYLSTIDDQIPTDFSLHENYPNPFNPATTLRFDLPEVSDVNVVIYNMLGQKVRTFNMNSISAGSHSIKWNATNDLGDPVGAGVYLYQLQVKDFMNTRKMILLK